MRRSSRASRRCAASAAGRWRCCSCSSWVGRTCCRSMTSACAAGFRAAYGLRTLPHPKVLAAWGERWRPYRSAAAWYLWRALELERAGRAAAAGAARAAAARGETPPRQGTARRRRGLKAKAVHAQGTRASNAAPARRAGTPSDRASGPAPLLELRLHDRVHELAARRRRAPRSRAPGVEEMNVNCSWGVRNTVSMSRSRWRLMLASWNSNSKSDTARRPRTMTAHLVLARELDGEARVAEYLDVRQDPASTRRASSTRFASGNIGVLLGLAAMATMTRSKMPAARRTRSWCPLVIGSNVPG